MHTTLEAQNLTEKLEPGMLYYAHNDRTGTTMRSRLPLTEEAPSAPVRGTSRNDSAPSPY